MSQIDDAIATRTIEVLDEEDRCTGTIVVSIGRPIQEPTGEWRCPFEISGVGAGRLRWGFGLDAIQAIEGALTVIGGTLAGTAEARDGRLRWAGQSDLGFPLPPEEGEVG